MDLLSALKANEKEEYRCTRCGVTYTHLASLNRHHHTAHGNDHYCKICNAKVPSTESVKKHMAVKHGLKKAITCSCCNWTFPDKREMTAHAISLGQGGHPGVAIVIAVSSQKPGSLHQGRGVGPFPNLRNAEQITKQIEGVAKLNKPKPRAQSDYGPGGVKKQKLPNGSAVVTEKIARLVGVFSPTRSLTTTESVLLDTLYGDKSPDAKFADFGLESVKEEPTDEEGSDVEAADSDVSSGEDYESDKDEVQKQIAQFQYAEEVDPSDDKKDKDYEYDEDDDDAYNNAVPVGSFGRKKEKYLTRTSNQNVKN
ncbi:unnamed protein product [Caenorhabditis auriculariae]|uniref:C2H2-type domain-containing protein n=1 Tax=Caenorhabditis auriculariae TaxID=2777116 RepID=A0A8S1HIQ3_9PELO|nr:unnamed protein product [Caenorhabditis auriculariae]